MPESLKDQGVKLEKHVTGIVTFQSGGRPYAVEVRPARNTIITGLPPEILNVPDLGDFIAKLQEVKRKADNEMPAPPIRKPVQE